MKVNKLIVFRRDFDNTAVLFNPDNGEVMGLNRTGAFLWEKLDSGVEDRDELLRLLTKACGGKVPDSAGAELDAFLADLRKHNFISD